MNADGPLRHRSLFDSQFAVTPKALQLGKEVLIGLEVDAPIGVYADKLA